LAEGDTEATIEVVPLPDNRVDPSETVIVTLTTTRPGYNVGEANTAVLRIAEPVPVKQFEEQTGTANPFNGVDAGFFSTPSFADIDGDGKLDVVIGNILGETKYYKNTGSANRPSFSEQTGSNNPFNNLKVGYFSAPSMVDIDGDGDLDAFSGEYGEEYGSIKYYKNIGSKTSPNFVEQTEANNPFNNKDVPGNSTPTFADLDGDGDLDAVSGDWGGKIYYYKNIGSANRPSFSEQTGSNNPFNSVTLKYYTAPSFADIDGDGDLDLFTGRNNGLIYYYENTGSISRAQFVGRTGASNPLNGVDVGSYSTPTFADINGDGFLDALSGNFNGEIKYYKNTGSSPPAPTVSSLRMTNETLGALGDTTTTNDPLDDDTGNNPLGGGDEQDTLTGSTGKGQLSDPAADDILLRGGIGNNQLSGSAGIDTFVLAPGEGTDTITDFMVDQDRIGLAEGLSFGQLTITQDGNDTLIKLTSDNETLAILSGVQSNSLTAADFTIL
jgi:Ca2+-binding RTX toxin-like protein